MLPEVMRHLSVHTFLSAPLFHTFPVVPCNTVVCVCGIQCAQQISCWTWMRASRACLIGGGQRSGSEALCAGTARATLRLSAGGQTMNLECGFKEQQQEQGQAPGAGVRPGRAPSLLCHAHCCCQPAPSCVGLDHAGRLGGAGRDSSSAQRGQDGGRGLGGSISGSVLSVTSFLYQSAW
eukprot:2024305-Rhodomonas_salina.1